MKRFFVNGEIKDRFVLEGEGHRHLSFVLRAKKNDIVALCNGDGFDYISQIEQINSTQTILRVMSTLRNNAVSNVRVTLFFAPLKGDKNDLVVQKATELGVCEIVPIMTQNVTVKRESVKVDRLNKISVESCKQCGRASVVNVREPISLNEALHELSRFDTVIFPYEVQEDCECDIKSFLKGRDLGKSVAIIIGSEGGFTSSEAQSLCSMGANSVSLGRRILRAETASIAVLAIVMYEAGELI